MARRGRPPLNRSGSDEIRVGGIEGADSGDGVIGGISDGIVVIDPAELGDGSGSSDGSGGASAGDAPKRRGRKPGSRSTGKNAKGSLDISGVEAILFSTHMMLSHMVSVPELQLAQTEAHEMAEAISNVSRHYDFEATQKSLDWARLAMALGMIYAPRIVAMRANRKPKRKAPDAARAPETDTSQGVIHFPPMAPNGGFTQ